MTSTKQNAIAFERIPTQHYPTWAFRPNTPMYPLKMNFIFLNGGAGDYYTWLQPIRWLADRATWIDGTLVCPIYLKEIATYFLKPYPRWGVKTYQELQDMKHHDDTPFRGPVVLQNESLNATGAHLKTCGWVYFTNKECAPDEIDEAMSANLGYRAMWDSYPQFKQSDLDIVPLPEEAQALEQGKYIVITAGNTTPSRHIKPEYYNYLIEYVKGLGYLPVFLGKEMVETGNAKNIHTEYNQAVKYDLGLNLINKTSLMQAAAILSKAALVVGHDNGLLHLAGMTAVPIVFGYNLASPQHREPIRPRGKTYNVTLTSAELACNHCQSNTNFVIGYNFRQCFYGDNKCIDMLFESQGERWKRQIDLALAENVCPT